MLYTSTRESVREVQSKETIRNGIAADGGLFVPIKFPDLSQDLDKLKSLNYIELAENILKLFLTDFSSEDVKSCVNAAYSESKFDVKNKVSLKKTDDGYFLELWHGPTMAFKDMALQILPHLLVKSQIKDKKSLILAATSGDTGKAALDGFKNVDSTDIIVFYPYTGVSRFQKFHMQIQEGSNVDVVGVDGNFDEIQTEVKKIFTDKKVREQINTYNYLFSSANSINWGRLVPQIVYYFYAYLQMLNRREIVNGETVNFVVPTGNFGNILAAYYASKMGLPIKKLICASNKNNILTDFFVEGVYDTRRSFYITSSPSMDILISSNLERLIYDISGRDSKYINKIMLKLEEDKKFVVDSLKLDKMRKIFYADYAEEDEVKDAIKRVFDTCKYLMDPHTAVAHVVYNKYKNSVSDDAKSIIVSTANPFKFYNTIIDIMDICSSGDMFRDIERLSAQVHIPIPNKIKILKEKKLRFDQSISIGQLKQHVLEYSLKHA